MTRKRFVKLLMGHGYSRNRANYISRTVVYPFKEKKKKYVNASYFDKSRISCEEALRAFLTFATEASYTAETLCGAIFAFNEFSKIQKEKYRRS